MNFIALLVTVVSAFLITSVIGMWLIPFLRRLHFGQTILDIGPAWHKSKQGTPTMGGVVFLLGYFGCTVICVSAAALSAYIPLAIVLLLLWFLIGWVL